MYLNIKVTFFHLESPYSKQFSKKTLLLTKLLKKTTNFTKIFMKKNTNNSGKNFQLMKALNKP